MKQNRNGEIVTKIFANPDPFSADEITSRFNELVKVQLPKIVAQRAPRQGTLFLPKNGTQGAGTGGTPLAAAFKTALEKTSLDTADRSAADYRAVAELVRLGYDTDLIKIELAAASGRKPDPFYYADRTVDRVVERYLEYINSRRA